MSVPLCVGANIIMLRFHEQSKVIISLFPPCLERKKDLSVEECGGRHEIIRMYFEV